VPVLERVTPEEALDRVRTVVGDTASEVRLNFGQVDVTCAPQNLVEVMTTLRDGPGIECRYFTFLAGVDRTELGGEEAEGDSPRGGLEVLVHVYSPDRGFHVNVHVPLDADNLVCPTITGVYLGCHWHERECHEMFGIDFEGHPHLVNLYLPEDFEGHPLRRSFRLPSRSIKEWPGAKDPEEAAAGGR
jgi:NADH-quinone oxidoreductase subunit C